MGGEGENFLKKTESSSFFIHQISKELDHSTFFNENI